MKVIASSLRKGNVLEIDGKLYAVLTVSNFHPGKGTPTTSADLRRLSDGVKVSERWRTVEQVERVNVDEREYDFLYEDGVFRPSQQAQDGARQMLDELHKWAGALTALRPERAGAAAPQTRAA